MTTPHMVKIKLSQQVLWAVSCHCSHVEPWDNELDACRSCYEIAADVVDTLYRKGWV